jgi:hypothetical protein
VPFAVTVNQWLVVKTAFSSKDAHIKAAGEYGFSGALGFGYAGGRFGPRVPEGFQTKESLTQSLAGVAIGASGIIVTYQAKFYVGIGAFGFTAGLWSTGPRPSRTSRCAPAEAASDQQDYDRLTAVNRCGPRHLPSNSVSSTA